MSLTSEQAIKIKSAVKTKLVEIGAYVDDQLSDYVMIMITNKKTEKQMTEDLELFLGGLEQAQEFSSWLHALIKRTIENDSSKQKSSTKTVTSSSSHHHHHSHKKSSNTPKSNHKNSTSSNGHSSVQNNESDELAIQIDLNEFNEDFHENDTKKRQSLPKTETITPEVKPLKKTENIEHTVKPQQPESTVNRFTKLVEQATKPTSSISSMIGAVIKHDEPVKDDHFKKRLSSIVTVSDNRKNVLPKSMQPNKSILLKAVSDANSSVKSSNTGKTKTTVDQKLEQIRSRHSDESVDRRRSSERNQVFSSHYLHDRRESTQDEVTADEQRVKRFKKFAITFEQNTLQQGIVTDTRRVINETNDYNSDSRLIITRSEDLLFSDKRKINIGNSEELMVDDITDEKRMLSTSTDSESSNNNISINLNKEPIFTVNLDSLENNEFIKNLNKKKALQKRTLSDMNDEFDDVLDYDEEIMDDNYLENDEMATEQDNNGENIEIDESLDVDRQKKKLIRCTFWPMCEKGDNCLFLHPNKPCTLFPNCTYGNLCHYLHPNCRYDGFCTRFDCTYTHMKKKPGAKEYPGKPVSETVENKEGDSVVAETIDTQMEQSNGLNKNMSELNSQSMSTFVLNKSNTSLDNTLDTTSYKFNKNSTTLVNNQIRMPRAAAPSQYLKPGANPYRAGSNPYSYSQQYSFVNRATTPGINPNCKYGNTWQNSKYNYVHPNLPQQSQMKWTAALTNTTNLDKEPVESKILTEEQIVVASQVEKPGVEVASDSVISQFS